MIIDTKNTEQNTNERYNKLLVTPAGSYTYSVYVDSPIPENKIGSVYKFSHNNEHMYSPGPEIAGYSSVDLRRIADLMDGLK